MVDNPLDANFLDSYQVSVYEPFSDFLMGSIPEKKFNISLLDVVRFAGHACPSMTGAFLIAEAAIANLYPETLVGVRGQIEIDIAEAPNYGAIGPMSNVFGFITGAWGETGFGGFQNGSYSRRNLIHFNSKRTQINKFCFSRIDTKDSVFISYNPSLIELELDPQMPFQLQWRHKIKAILKNPKKVISTSRI